MALKVKAKEREMKIGKNPGVYRKLSRVLAMVVTPAAELTAAARLRGARS